MPAGTGAYQPVAATAAVIADRTVVLTTGCLQEPLMLITLFVSERYMAIKQ
jgi:hypothetical protein